MIRLEIGNEIRHRGVMSLCAIEDLPLLLLLHHIAELQEIPFVSRFQGSFHISNVVPMPRLTKCIVLLFCLNTIDWI